MGTEYRYLNRGRRWLDFTWSGLQLGADGALRLAPLPRGGTPAPDLGAAQVPDAPAGVSAVPGGDVYFSDPDHHRLLVLDGCDATVRTVLRGDELHTPRGLGYHRQRHAVLIADSGQGRVLLYDLAAHQLVDAWGGFAEPRTLAADEAGHVYLVDHGAGLVRRLDRFGRELPEFWARVTAHDDITPTDVAVTGDLVVIAAGSWVYLVDTEGRPRGRWDSGLTRPLGLAASATQVYLGDNEQLLLQVFDRDGVPVGAALGWSGPTAALAMGSGGALYVHSGGATPPSVLTGYGYLTRGLTWGGPFPNPSVQRDPWHLLRAAVSIPPDANLQLHVATGDTAPPVDTDAAQPFADERWRHRPIAPDATETLFAGEPLDTVWVGVEFSGDGAASPELTQLRLDFAHETLLRDLPAIYRENSAGREFLARWLTLFESAFDAERAQIDDLAVLFDPAAVSGEFLPWLAGWLALELPAEWPTARTREAVAGAFAGYARRGTVAGLRDALHDRLGVAAVIEEPIVQSGWWALPADDATPAAAGLSVLGASTMLAAVQPQGAVVGTTAVLDGSTVAPQDEYATALFAEVAHRFTVRLYRGRRFCDRTVADAEALLQQEAPAHTGYHVCVVEPYLRVGIQAHVGVDAIVGEPAAGRALDVAESGGLVLGGRSSSRLGVDSEPGHIHL